jgi:hypothetical protein
VRCADAVREQVLARTGLSSSQGQTSLLLASVSASTSVTGSEGGSSLAGDSLSGSASGARGSCDWLHVASTTSSPPWLGSTGISSATELTLIIGAFAPVTEQAFARLWFFTTVLLVLVHSSDLLSVSLGITNTDDEVLVAAELLSSKEDTFRLEESPVVE